MKCTDNREVLHISLYVTSVKQLSIEKAGVLACISGRDPVQIPAETPIKLTAVFHRFPLPLQANSRAEL
jgi:hypothetical protein